MKILTIGGATQDIYMRYGNGVDTLNLTKGTKEEKYMIFEAGEKIEIDNLIYHTGGGATNSATSFQRLGFSTSCICKISNDYAGQAIIDELKQNNINASNIIKTKEGKTGTSIIINSIKGECTILAYRGINGLLKKEDINFNAIKTSDLIYITSLSYESSSLLPDISKYAKENNIAVATNPGKSQLAKGAEILRNSLKYIDILILNSSEAKTLMLSLLKTNEEYKEQIDNDLSKQKENKDNKKNTSASLLLKTIVHENVYFNLRSFFKTVLKLGPKIVVVTDGSKGVYISEENKVYFHPSIKTNVIDTLGAGDGFGSCFVGVYKKTNDIEKALQAGILNSSSVISQIGAKPGLLKWEELEKKLSCLDPKLIQHYDL